MVGYNISRLEDANPPVKIVYYIPAEILVNSLCTNVKNKPLYRAVPGFIRTDPVYEGSEYAYNFYMLSV